MSCFFKSVLCTPFIFLAAQMTAQEGHAIQNRYIFSMGVNCAIPSGERGISDIAVYGKQGDSTLAGYVYQKSLNYGGSVIWCASIVPNRRWRITAGIEFCMRAEDLVAPKVRKDPNAYTLDDCRRLKDLDLEIPLALGYDFGVFGIRAGFRPIVWSSTRYIVYDGSEKLFSQELMNRVYLWPPVKFNPFVRVNYNYPVSNHISLVGWVGGERRGWKNERTNWWDIEFGVGLGWR